MTPFYEENWPHWRNQILWKLKGGPATQEMIGQEIEASGEYTQTLLRFMARQGDVVRLHDDVWALVESGEAA